MISSIFITFSGNCKEALKFYKKCFGGKLQFDTFEELDGFSSLPVVSASLVSERLVIYGSDLVHQEGRTVGNYISIFLHCKDVDDRNDLIQKLAYTVQSTSDEKLIEIVDAFDVRWILSV